MAFSVRANLHFCRIAADYIFLCLRTDRYFLLRGDPAERFDRFLAGDESPDDLAWLVEHRLVANGSVDCPHVPPCVPRPTSSYREADIPRASLASVTLVLAAQFLARRELASRSLGVILARVDHMGRTIDESNSGAGLALAAAFHRARPYAPAIDQCLARGLAMKRMALRRKCDARLVIGVAMPFSAHCWIQAGEVVLSDPLDMILPYTPILAI